MLKKFFHIVLSIYLLAITAGVAVNKHYCGGSVISTALFFKAQSCFGMEEHEMESHCCRDEMAFFQLDEDFTSGQNLQFVSTLDFNILIPEFTFLQDIFTIHLQSTAKNQIAYSPPLLSTDITVEVQSFLI